MVHVVFGATLLSSASGLVAQAPPRTGEPLRVATGVDWFNVRAYGAVADGTHDDTPGIQAAIDAAAVHGGVVYLPLGLYRANGLRLEARRGVTFRGSGYGFTAIGSWIGTTIRSNGPAGGSRTVTATAGSPTVTVTGGGAVDAAWPTANIYITEKNTGYAYKILSVNVGAGTVTLAANYAGAGGGGLAATIEPTILTLFNTQQCTLEDLVLDGNNLAGSTLLAIDSNNVPFPSRATGVSRVALLHGHVGVRIGASGAGGKQDEGVVLERIEANEMDSTARIIWINSNNASYVEVRNSRLMTGAYAFFLQFAGPITIRSTYGGATAQTFVSLQGPYDTVTMEDCEHEPAGSGGGAAPVKPFLEILSPPNGPQAITLSHNTLNGPIVDSHGFSTNRTNIISIGNVYNRDVELGDFTNFTSIGDRLTPVWAAAVKKSAGSVFTAIGAAGPAGDREPRR